VPPRREVRVIDYSHALTVPTTDSDFDTPKADLLWFHFAPAVAACGRIRVSKNYRDYRRAFERNLDPRQRPTEPAAVRTYDATGETRCVAFDLDCKKGASRGAVLRDCERLTNWLIEAGCSYLIDESPSGGRHVYVFLEQPQSFADVAPMAKSLKSSSQLPTFDIGPLVNMSEGCIRPPGAAHRTGGHQRLVTPLPAALSAVTRRTSPASWSAFLALIPQPAPSPQVTDLYLPAREAAAAGQRLPLTPDYAGIAVTGHYDTRRYETPSQARGAVVMHALCRGWDADSITQQVFTGRWGGLAALYEAKYGKYTPKALLGDIQRCLAKLSESPAHRIHTSATRPRRGEGSGLRLHLRRWTAALQLALTGDRWNSGRSYGVEMVLLALGDAARRTQTIYPAFGVRHLSMGAGTVLDHSTVAKTLKLLASEDDPFILLVESDRGVDPDIYELRIPDRYLNDIPEEAGLPPAPYGIHPAFSALCKPAYRLYTALSRAAGSSTAADLARVAHMPIRTVHATLHELHQAKLVRCRDGRWLLGRRTLARFAHLNKIGTRLHDLVLRWRREREMLRIAHGLPERRQPNRFTVAWPGVAPPAQAPSRPTREEEGQAIGGGRPNWLVPDELEAAAMETLRESLGAVLITEETA
jgi:hypothetical protein